MRVSRIVAHHRSLGVCLPSNDVVARALASSVTRASLTGHCLHFSRQAGLPKISYGLLCSTGIHICAAMSHTPDVVAHKIDYNGQSVCEVLVSDLSNHLHA